MTCGKIYLVPLQKDIRLQVDEYYVCQWCYFSFTAEEIVEHIDKCSKKPDDMEFLTPNTSPERERNDSPVINDNEDETETSGTTSIPPPEVVLQGESVSRDSVEPPPRSSISIPGSPGSVDAETIISLLQTPSPLKRNEEKAFCNFKKFIQKVGAGEVVNGVNGNIVHISTIWKWIDGRNQADGISVSFLPDSVESVFPTVTENSLSLPTVTDYSEMEGLLLLAFDCAE